jgi:predicted CoA-binding protein
MNMIILWAQSLDNSSPDQIYDGRRILSQKSSAEREKIISLISQVTLNSKPEEAGNNVKVYVNNNNFVLSMVLPEKDVLNRKAPVLCYSQLTEINDPHFTQRLIAHISTFVKQLNRTIPSNIQEEIVLALSLVKKKRTTRATMIWIGVVLFLLLLLLLFSFMFLLKTG